MFLNPRDCEKTLMPRPNLLRLVWGATEASGVLTAPQVILIHKQGSGSLPGALAYVYQHYRGSAFQKVTT